GRRIVARATLFRHLVYGDEVGNGLIGQVLGHRHVGYQRSVGEGAHPGAVEVAVVVGAAAVVVGALAVGPAGVGAGRLIDVEAAAEKNGEEERAHQKLHPRLTPASLLPTAGATFQARLAGRLASTTNSTVVTTASAPAALKKPMPSEL